ncbi:MAG: hypothetical protein J6X40_00640 [Bacteroidales bacterium]|nr:hypothetical protein [Bacteroidales bacterium]
MHILSKSTYIKGLQCEKALYMTKKHPYLRDKLSIEQRARFQRGTDVGILAQQCFPGGVNMTPNAPSLFPKKVQETMAKLADPAVNVMYEAVFQYNDTLIMVDLLVRDGDRWKAIEVKSSLRLSPTYYNDAALQYYVLHGCGVPLSDFQLMHLNGDYVKNGDIDVRALFVMVSVLDYAQEKEAWVAANVERLKKVVALPHAPLCRIGTQCHEPYTCDFLGHCWKQVPRNSFLYSTALPDEELFRLYFGGFGTNALMLKQMESESEEAHQIEALESGSYYVDYKTLFALAPDPKPRSIAYLNLLLDRPAVPELDGTRPYQEMILAFALTGDQEPNGHTLWDCFEDHARWRESIALLTERLSRYDLIVCFTPLDLASTLMRHEITQNQTFGYKVFNLYEVLNHARMFHPLMKYDFSLQHVAQAMFHDVKLFEHSRIVVEAHGTDLTSYQQAKEDLITENEVVKSIYQHFFKKMPVDN